MAMAAKQYLLGMADKNYREQVEKRNAEIKKEQKELEEINQKVEKYKKRKEKK